MENSVQDSSNEPFSSNEYVSYGVTDDFAWYELSRMAVKMQELSDMFYNMQKTLKARSIEQQKYFEYLESKVRMLEELVPQDEKE